MDNRTQLRAMILFLIVVALALSLGAVLLGDQKWDGLALNVGTEIIGAVMVYALFELIIGRREQRRDKKVDLIKQMGSNSRDVAIAATEELGRYGWLNDGSLQGVSLVGANLQEADLSGAYLSGADLTGANLVGTDLRGADLRASDLIGANMVGADLTEADLIGAYLFQAVLTQAKLKEANLIGADLARADLQKADLNQAKLLGANMSQSNLKNALVTEEQLAQTQSLKDAILPDGTTHHCPTEKNKKKHPDL